MSWFTAHAVFYVKLKAGKQSGFPVWENMYLIQAKSGKDALDKATKLAKLIEVATKDITLNGMPAVQIFQGIRKVVKTTDTILEKRLKHGIELTYSQYEVRTEKEVVRMAKGKAVSVLYSE